MVWPTSRLGREQRRLRPVAAPAGASVVKTPVAMTIDAAPEPALQNSAVTVTGRAWYAATGNAGPVEIRFAPTGKAPTLIRTNRSNSRGDLQSTVVARTSGSWRAVYKGSGGSECVSRLGHQSASDDSEFDLQRGDRVVRGRRFHHSQWRATKSIFSMNNPEGSRCFTSFKVFSPKQVTQTRRVTV